MCALSFLKLSKAQTAISQNTENVHSDVKTYDKNNLAVCYRCKGRISWIFLYLTLRDVAVRYIGCRPRKSDGSVALMLRRTWNKQRFLRYESLSQRNYANLFFSFRHRQKSIASRDLVRRTVDRVSIPGRPQFVFSSQRPDSLWPTQRPTKWLPGKGGNFPRG